MQYDKILKYLALVILGFVFGIMINIPSCQKEVIYQTTHDTITITEERIVEKTRLIYKTDTLVLVDSVYVKGDSVYISLPMEYKKYSDTITTDSTFTQVDIMYHGIYSSIDSLYLKHTYQNKILKEPQKRVQWVWFVGPSVGYSVFGDVNRGTFGHGPSIGITCGIGIGGKL